MTLQEGTPGAQYVVTGIDLPLELERRLEALGLLEGSRVLVMDKKRRGAVIAIDADKLEQLEEMRRELRIVLARGCCKNISRREVHDLVDEIFDEYGQPGLTD